MMFANEGSERANARTLYIQVNFDGSANLFCGRAAEIQRNNRDEETKKFFSSIVAGNTTRFLALLGNIYDEASYFGMVDIGIGLSGLKDSVAYGVNWNFHDETHYYDSPDCRQTKRVSAMLLKENPKAIAADLLMPLIDAISQGKAKPFDVNKTA